LEGRVGVRRPRVLESFEFFLSRGLRKIHIMYQSYYDELECLSLLARVRVVVKLSPLLLPVMALLPSKSP
jgi:hypothetical protein